MTDFIPRLFGHCSCEGVKSKIGDYWGAFPAGLPLAFLSEDSCALIFALSSSPVTLHRRVAGVGLRTWRLRSLHLFFFAYVAIIVFPVFGRIVSNSTFKQHINSEVKAPPSLPLSPLRNDTDERL